MRCFMQARAASLENTIKELKAELDRLKTTNDSLITEKAAITAKVGEANEKLERLVSHCVLIDVQIIG